MPVSCKICLLSVNDLKEAVKCCTCGFTYHIACVPTGIKQRMCPYCKGVVQPAGNYNESHGNEVSTQAMQDAINKLEDHNAQQTEISTNEIFEIKKVNYRVVQIQENVRLQNQNGCTWRSITRHEEDINNLHQRCNRHVERPLHLRLSGEDKIVERNSVFVKFAYSIFGGLFVWWLAKKLRNKFTENKYYVV